jgi:hypothetical protein
VAARIGALVAAIAMVVAAVYARGRIDETAVTSHIVCSTELAEACKAVHVSGVKLTVEPAGTTFDRLVPLDPDADPGIDGWLVPQPWPQMVDAERARRSLPALFNGPSLALASSAIVVVAESRRALAIKAKCGDPAPDLACVASLAPQAWAQLGADAGFGSVKESLADPASEAEGLAVLGAVGAAALAGRPFDARDDTLLQRLRDLRRAHLEPGVDAVPRMLTSNAAELDMVLTTAAAALHVLNVAADRSRQATTVLYPAGVPVAPTISVVMQSTGSTPAGRKTLSGGVVGAIGSALRAIDWEAGVGTAPDPGQLLAMRQAWADVR